MDDGYHSDFSSITRTMLTRFILSSEEYFRMYVEQSIDPPAPKRPMLTGCATHDIALQGKMPDECIAVYPDEVYRKSKKDGSLVGLNSVKAAKFAADNPGKYCLKASESKEVCEAVMAMYSHPLGDLLRHPHAKFEEPVYWECPYSGLQCKCRPDFWIELDDRVICYDLKTTARPAPGAFKKVMRDKLYWVQDVHYSTGLEQLTGKPVSFVFWAVEMKFPHRIARYEYDPMSRQNCLARYQEEVRRLSESYANGEWTDSWTKRTNIVTVYESEVQTDDLELDFSEGD